VVVKKILRAGVAGFSLALLVGLSAQGASGTGNGNGSWPMYAQNDAKTGMDTGDTTITPTNAPTLQEKWSTSVGSPIFDQPIEADGLVFFGAFNGDEYALNPTTGAQVWSTSVGQLNLPSGCDDLVPNPLGVTGSAEFVSLTIGKTVTPTLFVAGGNSTLYALNATNGDVIWQTAVGADQWDYMWDSPVVDDGSVYIGVSSPANCPVTTQGQVFKINAATGAVEDTFDVVPNGCIGGGVWGSITLDAKANTIYVPTGSPVLTCSTSNEPLAPALLELSASNLSLIGSWQVPAADQIADSDFGSTATLFKEGKKQMVGIVNKNGVYYAFQRGDLGAGPVWTVRVSNDKSVQPLGVASYDGSDLYVTGGTTTPTQGTTACHKSLWKISPAGKVVWSRCILNGGLGAVSMVPGLILEGTSYQASVFSAASGKLLYQYTDSDPDSSFWGSGSFSDGEMFIGNKDGDMDAFAPTS
jgi:hypothetical protein